MGEYKPINQNKMQFNPGDGSGLVDEMNDICGSDNNNYPLPSKTRRLNAALDRFLTLALEVNESFHFDDLTNLDLPIGESSLNSGEQDVPFPDNLLTIRNVFVKDSQGTYHEIFEEVTNPKETITNQNNRGTPTSFRLMGGSLVFNKNPDYTQEDNGVLIHFGRAITRFVVGDTTKEPGIPVIFHTWLCQHASLPWLIEQQKANRIDIDNKVAQGEAAIKYHLANKNKTRTPRLGINHYRDSSR